MQVCWNRKTGWSQKSLSNEVWVQVPSPVFCGCGGMAYTLVLGTNGETLWVRVPPSTFILVFEYKII